ncbi:MAG: hypothetical protein CMI54_04860 [Parcubacteria group bacterium]|nr:hypothetical protein [Parcubacteria group bacterium]|tara:strand:+ start:10413 stop:11177 length:765 start_codon:yes stop_codon:yes gene_type:complete
MIKKFLTFFCPLCWRLRDSDNNNSLYCEVHSQPTGSAAYKRRRRQLEKVALSQSPPLPINSTFNYLVNKNISPETVNRAITSSTNNRGGDISNTQILSFISKYYKTFGNETKNIDVTRFNNIVSWGSAVIRAFNSSIKTVQLWEKTCHSLTATEQRKLFLYLVARIETEKKTLSGPSTKGPKVGSVKINLEIMSSLIIAYDEQKKYGVKVNLSRIAKEHNVSRQTIHKKWNKFIKNEKVYRKVIKNSKNKNKNT